MNYDDYWYFLTHKGDVGQPTRFKAQHFEKIELIWKRGDFQPLENRFSQKELYEYFGHLSRCSYKGDAETIQQ